MGINDGDERYLQTTVDALSEYFGYDAADLKQVITRNPESSYIRYDKQIPYEQKIEFENKKVRSTPANYKGRKRLRGSKACGLQRSIRECILITIWPQSDRICQQ